MRWPIAGVCALGAWLVFGAAVQAQEPAPPGPPPAATSEPQVLEAVLQSRHVGEQRVVFVLPPGYAGGAERYPAVVAWAGKGESVRGNRAGAWGWVEKYGALPAMAALHRGVLKVDDFHGLISEEELEQYNAALRAQPWRGVVLVCPYPPLKRAEWGRYGSFVVEEVIPYTQAHLRVFSEPARWGMDGISLGGGLAYTVGFRHLERFGAIGGEQAALSWEVTRLAQEKAPGLKGLALQIVTSSHDPFREDNAALSRTLKALGVAHRFTILRGHHDKAFVKGPGAIELLLFHDRALRGEGPMPPARP